MSSDQVERNTENAKARYCTTRRRIPWRLDFPVFTHPDRAAPADLTLLSLKGRRVYVLGAPASGSAVAVASAQAVKCYTDGHFPLVVADNGAQITYAQSWFGEGPYGAERSTTVWSWLENELRVAFKDYGVHLLLTPATTGRDLLARCTPEGPGWPCMSADVQTMVRATAGQGRMETMPSPGPRAILPGLYEYDARMAYAALMRQLPFGEPELLRAPAAADWFDEHPYNEGRYRVSWRAPAGWSHPGILPAHGEDEGGPDWVWPLAGTGWCGGAELFTAKNAGWTVGVHEALVWPERCDPFRTWSDRLARVLALSIQLPDVEQRMVRSAIRAIILHTIGAIHGAPHKTSEYGDQPPDGARKIRLLRDGRFAWEVVSSPSWPEMVHPEWSATIWGRARARLAHSHRGKAGFLTVDPRILVAFRTDAVYTTEPTGWDTYDDGTSVGRYRLKRHPLAAAADWPRNGTDILRLRGDR